MSKSLPSKRTVRKFVLNEARLIDDKKFDEWLGLFLEDAIYWMPLARDQVEEDVHNSLFYEDTLLLTVRVKRLSHPRAFSQQPPSYCQHVLQKPEVTYDDKSETVHTSTPFIYIECQGDEQVILTGKLCHQLKCFDGKLKIYRKRVDLLNRDAALPSIQLFP